MTNHWLARYLLRPQSQLGVAPRSQDKPAAVLLPLLEREGQLQLLLTRRSLSLRHHAGQISFPGGRFDPTDGDLRTTALRETHEELGIPPDAVRLLGRLPGYHTVTGFHITPYLGLLAPGTRWQAASGEVAEAFTLPLTDLLDPAAYGRWRFVRHGQLTSAWGISLQGHLIWGATARILQELARLSAE